MHVKKLVLVEIKTEVAITTINEVVTVQSKYGSFMECNFDYICKTTVGPHRILHNAVPCDLSDVLGEVKVELFTLVHISDVAMRTWLHIILILRTLIHKCVKWIVDVKY